MTYLALEGKERAPTPTRSPRYRTCGRTRTTITKGKGRT